LIWMDHKTCKAGGLQYLWLWDLRSFNQ